MSKIKQVIYEALTHRGFSEEEAIKLLKQATIESKEQKQPVIKTIDVYV